MFNDFCKYYVFTEYDKCKAKKTIILFFIITIINIYL